MNLKRHFSRFLGSQPDRLHFAAHSHHPWPDVSYDAHKQAWLDAAEMIDDKWEHIFATVMPRAKQRIASILGLAGSETLVIAPNTHELLVRVFSCLEPPVRVLTTDAEFHSFSRQSKRWEEEGLAIVDRVPAEPFDTFSDRFTREARAGVHDLIFLSEVFFNSGFVVPNLNRIVSSISEERAFVVIDGYHAFMARPTNIGSIQDRVFYLAGGYKYAMSGEGVCFLHAPPGYGERPVNTGWYAAFGGLESGVSDRVPYGNDGTRFAGATYDLSGIYRIDAVLGWLEEERITPAEISNHVQGLQDQFLGAGVSPGTLVPSEEHTRGNFLTFKSDRAADLYDALHARNVITDYRDDRLRIGFGIYHDEGDVERLATILGEIERT
ncbi:MAG: aminotransferase class V-fold PLP-dependent enzyme [Actinobacteria bacterium]|nr:aminotransferase class V-fold PLP-dependent enzyme [Actinomycetota bacterium]